MVTGNNINSLNATHKISISEVNSAFIEKYILSINIRIDGLSFLIQNDQNENIHMEYFEWLNVQDWTKTKNNLAYLIENNELLSHQYGKVNVFIQSTNSFIVPNELHTQENESKIYRRYLGIESHNIFSHSLSNTSLKAHLVYGIDNEIYNLIKLKWDSINWLHFSHIYVDECLNTSNNAQEVFVKIQSNYFEVVGTKNKALESHNYFEFSGAEEFIFNLLSFIRQSNFDINVLDLHLSGKIQSSSKLHQLVTKYIPNVHFEALDNAEAKDLFQELIQAANYENY